MARPAPLALRRKHCRIRTARSWQQVATGFPSQRSGAGTYPAAMPMRSDAQRNREALLAAADEVFRTEGAGAPLQHVAERAGVGRGTLYRHFPGRFALATALNSRVLDELAATVAEEPGEPDLAERILRHVTDIQLSTPGLMTVLRASEKGEEYLDAVRGRLTHLLEEPVRQGRESGYLRDDIRVSDFEDVVLMVEGIISNTRRQDVTAAVHRARELILTGIRGPAAREPAA